jgi:formylglycine-generating enzyme required for sulfatase activity
MRVVFALLIAIVGVFGAGGATAAEKRVALVIGNGAYRNAPQLPNPKNDAEDIAAAFRRSGFETILGIDLSKADMDDAMIAFARSARTADVAIFYYSGHAMQFAGINYLMPVDAKLSDEADLRRMARVDDIVSDIQQAKNLRILVLDSCRDNPLAEELKRSIGTRGVSVQRGLAKIDSPQGMIVAYSTQAGRTAEDGSSRNSPYTAAFLRHIEAPEEIGTVFRRISADVYEATQRTQLPEMSLSLIGEFYLRGQPRASLPSPTDPCATAEVHWKSAETIGTRAAFEDHLTRFGNCPFASLAKQRIEALNRVAVVAPPSPPMAPAGTASKPAVGVYSESVGSKAQPLSAASERALSTKETFKECENCPEMVVVPAGSFRMGGSVLEGGDNERPQHFVRFAQPFTVGKFAVTFDEWDACAADGGCNGYRPDDAGWARGRNPVINVNWDDAKAYVAWLSRKTGRTYRLLSEAEREYVTRAGTTTPFWWGNSISTIQANYDPVGARYSNFNVNVYKDEGGADRRRTLPVDSFLPNPFGLYQVAGNLQEWLEDCTTENYNGAPADGSAWTTGDCPTGHALRGGSWHTWGKTLRAAFRAGSPANARSITIGFRVARTLAQ